jgi:hypothetical protein
VKSPSRNPDDDNYELYVLTRDAAEVGDAFNWAGNSPRDTPWSMRLAPPSSYNDLVNQEYPSMPRVTAYPRVSTDKQAAAPTDLTNRNVAGASS